MFGIARPSCQRAISTCNLHFMPSTASHTHHATTAFFFRPKSDFALDRVLTAFSPVLGVGEGAVTG